MAAYWKRNKKNKGGYKRTFPNENKPKPPLTTPEIDIVTSQALKRLDEKVEANEAMYAQGVAIHSVVNRRTSSTYLQDVKDYTDAKLEDRVALVKLARKLRLVEGICSTVADLLIDFAITKGTFYCDNKDFEAILNRWAEWVNSPYEVTKGAVISPVPGLRAIARKIFDDYITDGDAIMTLFWKDGIKMDITLDKKALTLPYSIRVIDSTMVSIDSDLAQFGVELMTLKISDKLKEKVLDPKTPEEKELSKLFSKDWLKNLQAGKDIILSSNVTKHFKRNAKDYEPWGKSLFLKAFTAIANKRRLQAVDEATIDGLINRFTIFKLGLQDKEKNPNYHVPSAARVNALIDVLTTPKRANAMVWPGPDLDVIDIGPDGKVLEFVDKYTQADKDILRALHVSPLLIDGGSSGQAVRDWAAFISTEVGLDAIRDEMEKVFSQLGREIATLNKQKYTTLYYKFDTQLLKDEKYIRNFAIKVYELGGSSTQTFLRAMGYDFETEKRLRQQEIDEGLDTLFKKRDVPNIDPEGRPIGTKNTDLGKPSSDKTDDFNNQSARLATLAAEQDKYIEHYHALFKESFNKLKQDLKQKINIGIKDIEELELSLMSGFLLFQTHLEAHLREIFFKHLGGYTKTVELEELLTWNRNYVDRFYSDIRTALVTETNNISEVLDKQDYRLFLYAQEGYKKAAIYGLVAKAKGQGIKYGKWITSFKNSCEECISNHEKVFTLTDILTMYPVHPNCQCIIDI